MKRRVSVASANAMRGDSMQRADGCECVSLHVPLPGVRRSHSDLELETLRALGYALLLKAQTSSEEDRSCHSRLKANA
jgi:hypothetical protein